MTLASRLPSRAVAAALLAVVGVALAPTGATASCGNYVQIGIEKPKSHHEPAAPAAPCQGPGCSQGPAMPVLPLTAPVLSATDSEQSVAATGPISDTRPASGRSDPYAVNELPARLTSSIFHPPRAG